jgi:preprotein translocase subunit SecG
VDVVQFLFMFLYVLVCILLLLVVLLQQGKGGDIASAFGGSSSQAAFGARSGATLLTKATTVLGVLFMLGSLGLALVYDRGGSSIMSGKGGPAPVKAAAPKSPAPKAPASVPQSPTQQPAPTPPPAKK